MKIRKFRMISLIGFALLIPFGAFADTQVDLYLPGIPGTATVWGLTDLLPIHSFGYFDTQLTLDIPIGPSAPLLEQAVASERLFSSANIYVFESVGTGSYTTESAYTFSNVRAESFTIGDNLIAMEFGATGETIAQVPEPATVWLMLAGLGCLGLVARRRRTPSSRAAAEITRKYIRDTQVSNASHSHQLSDASGFAESGVLREPALTPLPWLSLSGPHCLASKA